MKKEGTEISSFQRRGKYLKKRQYLYGLIIVIALTITFVRFSSVYKMEKPLIVERQSLTENNKDVLAPELDFFLDNKTALKLTDEQTVKITALYVKYREKTKSLKEALRNASAKVSSYLDDKKNERVVLKDIQEHSQDVSQMSRELYEIRKTYFQQGFLMLKKQQRETVFKKLLKTKNIKSYFSLLYPDISPVLRQREEVP